MKIQSVQNWLAGLMALLVVPGEGLAVGTLNDLQVSIAFNKSSYVYDDPNDAIEVTLAITATQDVIATLGWQDERDELYLVFSQGNVQLNPDVAPTSQGNVQLNPDVAPEPQVHSPLPENLIDPATGQYRQATSVEQITAGTTLLTPEPGTSIDLRDYFTLPPGCYKVQVVKPISTYARIDATVNGIDFALLSDLNSSGAVKSNENNLCINADLDGDGFTAPLALAPTETPDCDDDDPAVNPGAAEVPNNDKDDDCSALTPDIVAAVDGRIDIRAREFILTRRDGYPWWPRVRKEPIAMQVRLYPWSDACVSRFSSSWKHRASLWQICTTPYQGSTDADGWLSMDVPPDSYAVIGKVPGEDRYLGRNKDVTAEETAKARLFLITRQDRKRVACRWRRHEGSELLTIEPEYIEWTEDTETYPFVFESEGDWTVTTAVEPPEGFVADQEAIVTDVNNELEAVQFAITDEGSDWVSTDVEFDILHPVKGKKGKKLKVKSKIGVKLSKGLARKKGKTVWGDEPPDPVKKPKKAKKGKKAKKAKKD